MDVSKSPHLWNDKPIYNLTKLANGFTCRTCGRSIKWVCKSLHVHICSWFMDHYYGTPGDMDSETVGDCTARGLVESPYDV